MLSFMVKNATATKFQSEAMATLFKIRQKPFQPQGHQLRGQTVLTIERVQSVVNIVACSMYACICLLLHHNIVP